MGMMAARRWRGWGCGLTFIIETVCVVAVWLQLLHVVACGGFTSFVFGDSLVDAGNNDYLLTLSRADSPPYGIDFAPSGGNPTGRFTNGRTISDILDEALGAKSFTPPYLAPNSEAEATVGGINYASGGSGILDETGSFFIGRVPLREQVDYFEQSRRYIVSKMGENGTMRFLEKAIFSLTVGSNDILNYIQPTLPFLPRHTMVSPPTFQDYLISNFTLQLKRLHGMGARKMVVVGVGPLGCIPFVRALSLLPSGQCSSEANDFIRAYNARLRHVVDDLNREMGPGVVFVYANAYDIVMSIIRGYPQFGFENADDPCCGGYIPPFICFQGNTTDEEKNSSVVCEDRSKYVFWDAYHPTEAANRLIADNLLDGPKPLCYPINLRQLHHYTPPPAAGKPPK
ncbi:GDSL esterase/lipase At5g41890 [Malania oleifera]|uniref:GDSL esterase/lipase At5g41890 n=1 Tax=Malania oleifera TaxID=397392 RepID=UPI0025ADE795|nr:GDSL esterase/lipase At5g41890 [Malania oleifera]